MHESWVRATIWRRTVSFRCRLTPMEPTADRMRRGSVRWALGRARTSSLMAIVELLGLDRTAWERVAENPATFAADHTLTLGAAPALLRTVGQQTVELLKRTEARGPWTGFLALDRTRGVIVGTCGFKAPPDAEGVVEIAYFTFPSFEGRGYASAMAAGLVRHASDADEVRRIRAHTLPEVNASTRILEKVGFKLIGEIIDPEDGPVWRWEWKSTARLEESKV